VALSAIFRASYWLKARTNIRSLRDTQLTADWVHALPGQSKAGHCNLGEALERRVVAGNHVTEGQPSWGMSVNVRIFMKHPVDIYVGKRIRHRRWVNGMTQQQLAEGVGIKF